MESTWTIAELADRATAVLAADPAAAMVNGRVRDMPNTRLIRWYTTIGLVDPPRARRGRLALYGERHLLQLVAIKRRQAAGRTIAQIQAELTGATDDTLRHIARLPDTTPAEPRTPGTAGLPAEAGEEGLTRAGGTHARFWTAAPSDGPAPDPAGPVDGSPAAAGHPPAGGAARQRGAAGDQGVPVPAGDAERPDGAAQQYGPAQHHGAAADQGVPAPAGGAERPDGAARRYGVTGEQGVPAPVGGLRLAAGALLVLDSIPPAEGSHEPGMLEAPGMKELRPDDLAAIGRAAGPLLAELRRRRLIPDGGPVVILPAAPSDEAPGRSK